MEADAPGPAPGGMTAGTRLAAGRKPLPREVDYPIKRDRQRRRYRIEPVAAELLLSAVDRARGTWPPRGWRPADQR